MFFRHPLNESIEDWMGLSVWVIGASSGIGLSIAMHLLRKGANVSLTARTSRPMEDLARKFPSQTLVSPADVREKNQIEYCLKNVYEKWKAVDVLIYLAASYSPVLSSEFDNEVNKEILDVNLTGFLNTASVIVPKFCKSKSGRIVIVSSVAGYRGLPNSLMYGATKAALINLAETMYLDLRPFGISVQLVTPGFVKTRLTNKNSFAMPMIINPDKAAENIVKGVEQGRFEIHFPKIFTIIMKTIAILPYRMYFYIIDFIKKP